MANKAPTARSVERPFNIDELFFSVTDLKGIILSGNDVFTRISAYSEEELLGEPHNLIRHPDMPRCVFKLLWDEIEAGRPIAAYVKNLARDGAYYWVMAIVVPIEGGYLSVRLKPSTAYFEAAQSIYKELLAVEQKIEGANLRDRKPAMEASTARLGELLVGAGFPSYQAFMNLALPAEVLSRDQLVGVDARKRLGGIPSGAGATVTDLLKSSSFVNAYVDELLGLDAYSQLGTKLTEKAGYIEGLSTEVGMFSLNALLAASRAGEAGAALSAVASLLRSNSEHSVPTFQQITDSIGDVTGALGEVLFIIAATKMQSEVAMVFAQELASGEGDRTTELRDMTGISESILGNVDRLTDALDGLERQVLTVRAGVDRLRRDLNLMRALEVNGRIEAVHVPNATGIVTFFNSIGSQIHSAREEVDELVRIADVSFNADRKRAQKIARAMSSFQADLIGLAETETETENEAA